jgi:type I restriction enzyme R subunit
VVIVKDHLSLLDNMFHKFNSEPYFTGESLEQLQCLNNAANFVQQTKKFESDFMGLVKRLKSAYNICTSSNELTQDEKDKIYYYLAIRTIVFKITTGNAPDITKMNKRVKELIEDALQSSGVSEVIKFNADADGRLNIFDEKYLAKVVALEQPHTKLQLLQQMLAKAIGDYKKINKIKGIDFTKRMNALIEKYNERNEHDVLKDEIINDLSDKVIDLYQELKKEMQSSNKLGIDIEEKAFYDILFSLTKKYDFNYPEDKLLYLAKQIKQLVDDKTKYTDWDNRSNIKAELQFDLMKLLDENGYPPKYHEEVYKDVFEQAESFKRNKIKTIN